MKATRPKRGRPPLGLGLPMLGWVFIYKLPLPTLSLEEKKGNPNPLPRVKLSRGKAWSAVGSSRTLYQVRLD